MKRDGRSLLFSSKVRVIMLTFSVIIIYMYPLYRWYTCPCTVTKGIARMPSENETVRLTSPIRGKLYGTTLYDGAKEDKKNVNATEIQRDNREDSKSNLTWPCCVISTECTSLPDQKCFLLSTWFVGALGNEMFAMASLIGLAKSRGMTPFVPEENIVRSVFRISIPGESTLGIKNSSEIKWTKHWEHHSNIFRATVHSEIPTNSDVILVGYFQSWKYFLGMESLLRTQFAFKEETRNTAQTFISHGLERSFNNQARRGDVVIIGVHVRRGDMLKDANVHLGYTVADVQYIKRAMHLFEVMFSQQKLLYVVCTDPNPETLEWAEQTVQSGRQHPVVFSRGQSAGIDLAILSFSDHVIQTVGTFGWWGAFLSGGRSTYYGGHPKPGSALAASFNTSDYHLAHWIPL